MSNDCGITIGITHFTCDYPKIIHAKRVCKVLYFHMRAWTVIICSLCTVNIPLQAIWERPFSLAWIPPDSPVSSNLPKNMPVSVISYFNLLISKWMCMVLADGLIAYPGCVPFWVQYSWDGPLMQQDSTVIKH